MKLIAPDYYKDFRCIAGDCRHSCCIGWEIDVDPDKLVYYDTVTGPLGDRLKKSIDRTAQPPHFILGEHERCPFLNQEGLCDLIIGLGENSLCQICRDHPRYRSFFVGRTEIGVGLCCEAAAALILKKTEKTTLVTLEDDGICAFPDAPTERGTKHLKGLTRLAQEGYGAYVLFVIQMPDVKYLHPNDKTDPAFGAALREAAENGVQILAMDCAVTEDTMEIRLPVLVKL